MLIFRSIMFNLFFPLWTAFVAIIFVPSVLLPLNITLLVARLWARGVVIAARLICNIEWEIRGQENIPQDEPLIIAAKHQSAWETVVMYLMLKRPLYVLKKELKYLPIFGWYISAIKCVTVDRSKGSSALKSLIKQSLGRLNEGRHIVIFPEGTRIAYGEKGKYHTGISAIYAKTDVKVIPMALNSGKCWPKNGFRKYPGKIIFEFLPPIESGMDRKKFMVTLEEQLENASGKL